MTDRFSIFWNRGTYYVTIPNYDGGEVVRAEAFDRLTAENEGLKDRLEMAHSSFNSAMQQIDRLKNLLEPFAELAEEGNEDQPDDTVIVVKAGRTIYHDGLTLGDARRARAALTPKDPDAESGGARG